MDRAAIWLGAGAMVSALLMFVRFRSDTSGASSPPHTSTPASLTGFTVIVLVALGALAIYAGWVGGTAGRALTLLAGVGFAAVAVVFLVQAAIGERFIAGNTSTMALFGGLAVGMLAIGLTPITSKPD